MSTAPHPQPASAAEPRRHDVFAAFLSYLVPGLGQLYQGRFGKGLMFMVCLLGMFLLGMYLGNWSNVYLPKPDAAANNPKTWIDKLPGPLANVANRLPFAGQFWIGMAAWPAILQHADKWPMKDSADPFWQKFQETPLEDRLNQLQRDSDKSWDLGWVYTVIAGVLNILVIYDALAGPVFAHGALEPRRPEPTAPVEQEAAVP